MSRVGYRTPKNNAERAVNHYGITEEEYYLHPELYPLPERGTMLARGVIAEGTTVEEIQQAIAQLSPGQVFDLQLQMPHYLSQVEIAQAYDTFTSYGVVPGKFYQDRANVLHIQLQQAKTEGVGILPLIVLIPLILGGGFFTWKIVTMSPMEYLTKSLPFILLGAGAIYLLYTLNKKGIM